MSDREFDYGIRLGLSVGVAVGAGVAYLGVPWWGVLAIVVFMFGWSTIVFDRGSA